MRKMAMLAAAHMSAAMAASFGHAAMRENHIGSGVRNYTRRMTFDSRGNATPFANLSRFHPDYGMSPSQHAANKRGRETGTVAFVPKSMLKQRRVGLFGGMGL